MLGFECEAGREHACSSLALAAKMAWGRIRPMSHAASSYVSYENDLDFTHEFTFGEDPRLSRSCLAGQRVGGGSQWGPHQADGPYHGTAQASVIRHPFDAQEHFRNW